MLAKIRQWKYLNIFEGLAFMLCAILFIIGGGLTNWIIAICLIILSIVIITYKSSKHL